MNHRILGRTGISVSELALGGLFVSSVGGAREAGIAAIRRAAQLGINYIDTAPGYANSEEVVGAALEELQSEGAAPMIVSTKLGGRPTPFEPKNRDHLLRSVEESLRLLNRTQIDLLMIHEPDRPGQYDWWDDEEDFDGPVLRVLAELKQGGTIRFFGLAGTTAYRMARLIRTGKFDVVLTAFNYSLLWREAEREVLPAALEQNLGIIIGSPLQQGALAQRYDDEVNDGASWLSAPRRAQFQQLYRLAEELEMPLAEIALRWVLSNPNVACVLMGARSPEEVERNVAASENGSLPPEVLSRLATIAAQVPFRPFDEPAGLPFGRAYRGPGAMS